MFYDKQHLLWIRQETQEHKKSSSTFTLLPVNSTQAHFEDHLWFSWIVVQNLNAQMNKTFYKYYSSYVILGNVIQGQCEVKVDNYGGKKIASKCA